MKNIQDLFTNSGLTLSELSNLSGVSTQTISKYIKSSNNSVKNKYYNSVYNVLKNLNNKDVPDHIQKEDVNPFVDVSSLKEKMMSNGITSLNTEHISTNNQNIKESTYEPNQNCQTYSTYNNINAQKIKRGTLWFVKNQTATSSEIWGSRLAVVVSSDKLNSVMSTVEVVYVTSKPRIELPTHCTISTERELSVVLCEQISSVAKNRLYRYQGEISCTEMMVIEKAMRASLDLKAPIGDERRSMDYAILQSERNFYKTFYENMMKIQTIQAESYALKLR